MPTNPDALPLPGLECGVALLGLLAPAPVQMSILLIAALCLGVGSAFGSRAGRVPTDSR